MGPAQRRHVEADKGLTCHMHSVKKIMEEVDFSKKSIFGVNFFTPLIFIMYA